MFRSLSLSVLLYYVFLTYLHVSTLPKKLEVEILALRQDVVGQERLYWHSCPPLPPDLIFVIPLAFAAASSIIDRLSSSMPPNRRPFVTDRRGSRASPPLVALCPLGKSFPVSGHRQQLAGAAVPFVGPAPSLQPEAPERKNLRPVACTSAGTGC